MYVIKLQDQVKKYPVCPQLAVHQHHLGETSWKADLWSHPSPTEWESLREKQVGSRHMYIFICIDIHFLNKIPRGVSREAQAYWHTQRNHRITICRCEYFSKRVVNKEPNTFSSGPVPAFNLLCDPGQITSLLWAGPRFLHLKKEGRE